MEKIKIFISIFIFGVLLSGCGGRSPSAPKVEVKYTPLEGYVVTNTQPDGITEFIDVNESKTLIKVIRRSTNNALSDAQRVFPVIQDIKEEVKKRGYQYFQIVSPAALSNLEGFPINNEVDLINFLQPAIGMPRGGKTHWGGKSLMDNNTPGRIIPRKLFNKKIIFECVIRLVENPEFDEIVWDVNAK